MKLGAKFDMVILSRIFAPRKGPKWAQQGEKSTTNNHTTLPETSTIEMEIEGHCSLLHFRGGFWYIKPGGNDYKYSKRPFFVQGPLILSGSGGCCV